MDIADPELKTVFDLTQLDPEDPDDLALQTRVLNKMKREHKKDFEELIENKIWHLHDVSGNLVPHKFIDGHFVQVKPDEENGE